jgi:hypothetical protein
MPLKSSDYPVLAHRWANEYGSKAIREKAIKKLKEKNAKLSSYSR